MAERVVSISNGKGTINLNNGNYNISSNTNGYENNTIYPVALEVTSDKDEYSFTIAGSGMLMIYTYDGGSGQGRQIEGATFYRCTKDGTTYGNPVVSDSAGWAYLTSLPYHNNHPVYVYFVQTSSDGAHSFSTEVHEERMVNETGTVLVENPKIE